MPIQLLSASAGSGKTYQLAIEFISLAIHRKDNYGYYRKILAVTFTNKAAQEMRARILKFLFQIYSERNQEFIYQIKEKLIALNADLSEEEIIIRAENTHQQILQDYGLFSVMTIDSFVQKLSGSFWNELNLPNNYEIELDSELIIDHVLNAILWKIQYPENTVLKEVFIRLVRETVDKELGWSSIREKIKFFLANIFMEEFLEIQEAFKTISIQEFLKIDEKINDFIRAKDYHLLSLAKDFTLNLADSGLANSPDYWHQGNRGPIAYIYAILNKKKTLQDKISFYKDENTKLFKSGLVDDETESQLVNFLHEMNEYRQTHLFNYVFAKELHKDMNNLVILRYFQQELVDFELNKGIIPISEFSKKIYETIANDPVPFIFEKLGNRYEHILIDEFQDTSLLQWKNFMPLLENATDGTNKSLIVGDSKQAIYAFRGGDVKIFDTLSKNSTNHGFSLSELDAQRFNSLKQRVKFQQLTNNYRSSPSIVNFNNSFFEYLSKYQHPEGVLFNQIYSNNIHQNVKKAKVNISSRIEIHFLSCSNVEERNHKNIQRVREKINELIDSGIQLKDIAVLTRKNSQLRMIVEDLLNHAIPVKSSDFLYLDFSNLFQFIKSFLSFINDPNSKFHFFHSFYYFNQMVRNQEIEIRIEEGNNSLKAIFIQEFEKLNYSINRFFTSKLGILDILQELVEVFGLLKFKSESDYLFRLLDIVEEFSLKNSDQLTDFLNYLEENKNTFSINATGEIAAISVATIHKSKGLEYPIVLLPFFVDDFKTSKDSKWIDLSILGDNDLIQLSDGTQLNVAKLKLSYLKEDFNPTEFKQIYQEDRENLIMETMNAFYVATTRAESQLYLFTDIPKEPNNDKFPNLSFLIDQFLLENSNFKIQEGAEDGEKVYQMINLGEEVSQAEEKSAIHEFDFNFDLPMTNKPKLRILHDKNELYSKTSKRIELGNRIHELLANQTDSNLEEDIDFENDADLEKIIKNIDSLRNHSDYSYLFDNTNLILTEIDIILNENELIRPDRIIQFENIYYVIDFKTGKKDEKNILQIKKYKQVLEELGFENVHPVLIYLKENLVEYV